MIKKLLRHYQESELLPSLHQLRAAQLWLSLTALALALTWGGYRFGDRYGLLVGFFSAVSLLAMVFFYDEWRVAAHFVGIDLEGRDPWGILRITRESARHLDLATPIVRQIASDTPFVFSTGVFASRLRIFVSSGLNKRLSMAEVQALIQRELMRSKLGLTKTMTASAAFADLWLLLVGTLDAAFMLRPIFGSRLKRWCPGPFTWVSIPFVRIFLRLVISRHWQLEVDRKTAETFGNGRTLAEALLKVDAYNKTLPLDVTLSESVLFATDPLAAHDWSEWLAVHPPMDARIRLLTGQFPL